METDSFVLNFTEGNVDNEHMAYPIWNHQSKLIVKLQVKSNMNLEIE